MCFYYFIMIYLASNLSNAILFNGPPLDKNSNLIDICKTKLKNMFQNSKNFDKGMDFTAFKGILDIFCHLHQFDENQIKSLFTQVVGEIDKLMDKDQFLIQVARVVRRIELRIQQYYTQYLHLTKMTKNQLINAITDADLNITDERATELIKIEMANAEDISCKEFRNIYAKIYLEYLEEQKQKLNQSKTD
ncbi:uncharacterized protein LOC126894566 isoform X2 [Daktulosphaira vitifoliae]|uniref:uncharacterized protein LOC126894566 isoform X2 n=1 Tax=Daktulosphaira vitifoliae TaxID=58002 RepID=UPI0021A9FEF4|nr:uncharacterized protein LOC126894566 isoform X2 [Daktulosphaira vitifoliae]